MGFVSGRLGQGIRLLIIAQAIVGVELDVISNPFAPEVILYEFYSFLESGAPDLDSEEATELPLGFMETAELTSEGALIPRSDETVAIRARRYAASSAHLSAPASHEFTTPGEGQLARFAKSPRASWAPIPSQLCRFLC